MSASHGDDIVIVSAARTPVGSFNGVFASVPAHTLGTVAIQAALIRRSITGLGGEIDMALLDTQVGVLANQALNFLVSGRSPRRLGNAHPNIVPYQVFASQDGYIVLSVGNDPTFARFCQNTGLEHLLTDERFATNAARVGNRQLVTDTLTPTMKAHPTTWWVDQLEAIKVGCGPINTLEQVFADPQVVARGAVVQMPHASTPDGVKVIANPVRLSETPVTYRMAPPVLGQHTDEVLAERLGLDEAARAALRAKGVI